MINNVYATNQRVTTDLMSSEAIKTGTMDIFTKVVFSTQGDVIMTDYKKYKADLIEMMTKEKIKPILNKALRDFDKKSANEIITALDIREFRGKLESAKADIDINSAMFEVMDELNNNDNNGIVTGLAGIDRVLGCIQDEELVVLTAEPSAGKSTLGLQMLLHNSMERGKNGIFISLEMSKKIAVRRMMSSVGSIDNALFKTKPTESDYKRMLDAQKVIYPHLDKMKLICDLDACSGSDIRTLALSIKRANNWEKIDFILIDYLQYMTPNKDSHKEHEALADNIKTLKALTLELNCAIIIISSLGQDGKIYGSSVIKFAADYIIFLRKGDTFSDNGLVSFEVQKNRNGAIFNRDIKLNGKYLKFEEIDKFH